MSAAERLFKQVGRIEGFGRRILGRNPSRAFALATHANCLLLGAASQMNRRGAGGPGNASHPLDLWFVPPRTLSWNDRVSLAERAMDRAACVAVADLGRGLTGLACVASSALAIGVVGSVFRLAVPDLGCGSVGIAAFGQWFAEVLFSAALGLFVAVFALAAHRRLVRERDNLAVELPHALASVLSSMAARTTERCRGPGFSTWKARGARFPIPYHDSIDAPIRHCTSSSFYKLLILWVVVATLLRFLMVFRYLPDGRINVNVPRTAHPVLVERLRESFIVSIKADGQRFVGRNWTPQERFAEALLRAREDSQVSRMLLQADRYLPYLEVREVLRSARDAGFTSVTFITLASSES